jgi:hypothetical protein
MKDDGGFEIVRDNDPGVPPKKAYARVWERMKSSCLCEAVTCTKVYPLAPRTATKTCALLTIPLLGSWMGRVTPL